MMKDLRDTELALDDALSLERVSVMDDDVEGSTFSLVSP
jgi:hypothetical protein